MKKTYLDQLKETSILCVEDEEGIREIIVKTLKYYFDTVYEASNGVEAYEMYQKYQPKIILSDIKMNEMDGIELIKKVRKIDLNVMVIMLTAYSDKDYLLKLINLDINHYILKPLNLEKLNEALVKYVQRNLNSTLHLHEDLVLDVLKSELIYKNNQIISLRKREKTFLELLHKNREMVIKYEQIEFELWKDKEMTTHALKTFIKELRLKIPINIIKNVSQIGYILE